MINAELACLDFPLFFCLNLGSGKKRQKADLLLPLTAWYAPLRKPSAFLAFFSGRWRGCSFSSAAHLVGYYVKEMESIAEWWVMLFTGKSDDQRQGITPSRSDVSWKIPLFHREEGKVQRALDMVGMTGGAFVRKRWRTQMSPQQWDSKKCQECKTQRHTCSTFHHLGTKRGA